MRHLSISHNTRTLLKSKPPTVVFLVCLLCFVLVLFMFIAYVRTHDVHNPDEIDWNIFREKMASLDYCVKYPTQNPIVILNNGQETQAVASNEKKFESFY